MSFECSWYLQDHIILIKLCDEVTVADLTESNTIITQWLRESGASRVHIIFDASKLKRVAYSARQSLVILRFLRDPRVGCFVAFGIPPHLRGIASFLVAIIERVARAQIHSVETSAEALDLICSFDADLPEDFPCHTE
jgi:hypothetical protein